MVDSASAGDNKTNPVGTGPFKFSKWAKGSLIELVRNDGYWGEAKVLDKAVFRFIPDPAAAVAALTGRRR